MGILQEVRSGDRHHLASTQVVGRSPSCQVTVHHSDVSGVHAEIIWDGTVWQIQDLASRNGTFLDGKRLSPRERVMFPAGAEVGFGTTSNAFRLVDVSAPRLMAISPSGTQRVADEDGLLALPSSDKPEVTIYCDSAKQWIMEQAGVKNALSEGTHVVVADSENWRLEVPFAPTRTESHEEARPPNFAEVDFEMIVSRDGEHVDLSYLVNGTKKSIESRAHLQLLVVLTESFMSDKSEARLARTDWGWVHRDDLQRMLLVDTELLNLWVFRIRQQMTREGIVGGAGIIERRPGTSQMRIGSERCSVRRL